jgi:hypothetical protein
MERWGVFRNAIGGLTIGMRKSMTFSGPTTAAIAFQSALLMMRLNQRQVALAPRITRSSIVTLSERRQYSRGCFVASGGFERPQLSTL